MKKPNMPPTRVLKTRVQEGDYSHDELARMLLWASGTYLEAKKALTRAHNELDSVAPWWFREGRIVKRGNDTAIYLSAYAIQKKLGCSDFTALQKLMELMGGSYRVYWDRLKAQKLTLKQIARLVQNPPKKS